MRRAMQHGIVTRRATSVAAVSEPGRGRATDSASTRTEIGSSPAGSEERIATLVAAIVQRIEARLPGRVRNLSVRIHAELVVLEGQCATYYTKQLAQHAALGVLEEDDHLENAIVVTIR